MSAAAAIAVDRREVELEKVVESPFNTRRTWGNLQELADNIRAVGILQELLARPHPKKLGHLELVYGHRRFRAAKLAELATVPVRVRELTDAQAVEIQCIENLQREDIHPLEEAEGYEQLLKVGKLTAEEIAARIGKSRSYVFGRLKLLALCPGARKAFVAGTITASVALYIARIPSAKVQKEALDACLPYDDEPPLGAREAFRIIEQRYFLRLAEAPWDRADATLVSKAGACTTCPKRTGNQPELFADVKSTDVCTDPECFAAKKTAHGARKIEEASANGKKILDGKTAEKALREAANSYSGATIDLDETCYDDQKRRTYRQLLKGSDIETAIALDKDGEVHELAPRAAIAKLVKSVKVEKAIAGTSRSDEEKKRRKVAERKRVRTLAIIEAIVAAAKGKADERFWAFLAELLLQAAGSDALREIAKRRRLEVAKPKPGTYYNHGERKALRKALEAMSAPEARGLAVELALSHGAFHFGPWGGSDLGKGVKLAAEHYGVDVEKVGAAAVAASKASKAEKKKSKRKAGAK